MRTYPHALATRVRRAVDAAVDVGVRHLSGTHHCSVCQRSGRFSPTFGTTGRRGAARCPHCGALERHRLQAYVLDTVVVPRFSGTTPRVLHVAPERSLAVRLEALAGTYETADYAMPGVDHHVDLRDLPFETGSFDILYASHVLEHVDRDTDALCEISRVLRPGGVAVLPVPLIGAETVEYPAPNPFEALHVRAPGLDYFDRYRSCFSRVDVVWSSDAPDEIQPYLLEDRSHWPTETMPHRRPSDGERHLDAVPLCWK